MNATSQIWTNLFTHIQHDTGAIDREVLVRYIPWPILTTEYSLPSQWITVSLLLIYFRYDPNNNSNCDEEWQKPIPTSFPDLLPLKKWVGQKGVWTPKPSLSLYIQHW